MSGDMGCHGCWGLSGDIGGVRGALVAGREFRGQGPAGV